MRRLAVLAFCVCMALPLGASAQVQTSFAVTLEDLVPGVPRSEIGTVELDRDATLRGLTWLNRTGILGEAILEVQVCVPGDWCVDANDPDDSIFPAGTLDVFITATLPASAPVGGSGSATGQLIFFADSDDDGGGIAGDPDLPLTGIQLMRLAAWAAAFVSFGALIVTIARRAREEEGVL